LVVEFLVIESGNIRFYDDDEFERANLTELIAKIRREFESLEINFVKK